MTSLTCVSCMEQDGAGREAEAGHVCTELNPLETRVETQQQCKLQRLREPQTKGLEKLLTAERTMHAPTSAATQHHKCQTNNTPEPLCFRLKTNVIFMLYWESHSVRIKAPE